MRPDRFIPGRTYRRSELHDLFGGNRQKGISAPAGQSFAFLFTGPGARYGYADRWIDTDTFEYSGEGLSGDMTFGPGNKAILDRSPNLHLFEVIGGGQVKYRGLFRCSDHRTVTNADSEHRERRALIFRLSRVIED
jgi:5-methylcytosine-specific restriction enzyme A